MVGRCTKPVKKKSAKSNGRVIASRLAVPRSGRYGAAMGLAVALYLRRVFLIGQIGGVVACTPSQSATLGSPLPGLPPAELRRFHAGKALFERVFTDEDGLGPFFNENQCSACHTVPASGGTTGFERIVKATRFHRPGDCDILAREGGENVRTQVTARLRPHGIERQPMPRGATEVGRFTPPFLFGLGLIQAIPDRTILIRADPADGDRDGISGRVGRATNRRLARFGRKAEFATIADFVESALRLEMCLTTPRAPAEVVPQTITIPSNVDLV